MPVAKFRPSSKLDAMKAEEGNDSLDNFIRQAVGKDPLLSFSRTGDSPVQWIQLLNALDQQDLPGWPLLTPVKVQTQKCEKCSRQFCSSINYRRHVRVHRRSFNPDKDSVINRDLLGAFWDKLSYDKAEETVSFKNVFLEEIPGSSIIKALTSFIRKPGFLSPPHVHVKAGSALLDIIQARASRFPPPSQELFSILDDASEKTFLCGTAMSMQKYIFDGEAGKIGLEMKNLVACTSFFLEQKLVKAWVADKDTEALRCHKLLVEEEEAAQKRKAEVLEKKRKKKLRQKEQKAKEQANEENANLTERLAYSTVEPAIEPSGSPAASSSDSHSPATPEKAPFLDPTQHRNDLDGDVKPQTESGEHQTVQGSGHRQSIVARWHIPKPHRIALNGFHLAQNGQVSKHDASQRHGPHKEPKAALVVNRNKVWTRKSKPEHDEACIKNRIQKEGATQPDHSKSYEVLIGSIPVELRTSYTVQDKAYKMDSAQSGVNRSVVKLWKPVCREGGRDSEPSQSGNRVYKREAVTEKANARSLSSESCLTSCAVDECCNGSEITSVSPMEESANSGGCLFSIRAAEAFLMERWKAAISAEHVQLVLSPEFESSAAPPPSPKGRILCAAENQLTSGMAFESSTVATVKPKSRTKPEKGVKLKYIPKQRNNTKGG